MAAALEMTVRRSGFVTAGRATLSPSHQLTDTGIGRLDVDALLRELLGRVVELLGVDIAAVLLLDEPSGQPVARAPRPGRRPGRQQSDSEPAIEQTQLLHVVRVIRRARQALGRFYQGIDALAGVRWIGWQSGTLPASTSMRAPIRPP
jgi:hypothetical protein